MLNILRKLFIFRAAIKRRFYTALIKKTCKRFGPNLTVNAYCKIGRNVILGENNNFNGMVITDGGIVTFGDNFHSGRECMIINRYHNFDHGKAIPYDNTYISKDVNIGDNVWLGHRVIILGGVNIGEGVILQAGCVVVSDIPDYAIAGGNPAKVFKYRDIEHYKKLKAQNSFH